MKKYIYLTLAVVTMGFVSCSDGDDELDVETTQEEQTEEKTENTEETGSEEEEVVVTYAATITNTDLAAVLATSVEGVTLDEYGNALITQEVIDSTTELDISEQELTSLSGIECFVNLTSLNCSGNPLDEFDVSDLTNLQVLNCSSCFGQTVSRNYSDGTLDVSALINLLELDCSSNNLTVLIVSENEQLVILDCSDNNLTELDLSNNTELEELYCSSNGLTALDLSNNTELLVVVCYDNQLTTLDVSTITALETLLCGTQQTDGELTLVVSDEQLELWESELEGEDENEGVIILKDEESTGNADDGSGDGSDNETGDGTEDETDDGTEGEIGETETEDYKGYKF